MTISLILHHQLKQSQQRKDCTFQKEMKKRMEKNRILKQLLTKRYLSKQILTGKATCSEQRRHLQKRSVPLEAQRALRNDKISI
ncbi:hypothetical protein PVAP13_3KG064027 [Panicum virgatum]|uniref:Uncharacterized protein n=1 Tax=Panicum virgatum TaxID=38727 RepID=A0A8T0UFS0_PANVG|nr:hypothetical protein PVAP13_3KG064027 [Panicum virgatum]